MSSFLKKTILGVLIGQLVYLFIKDDKVRNKVNDAEGFDKLKVIGGSLLDLNKKFVDKIKNEDYDDYKEMFADYKGKAEDYLDQLKEYKDDVLDKDGVAMKYVKKMENRINEFVADLSDYKELGKKYVEEHKDLAKKQTKEGMKKVSDTVKKAKREVEDDMDS